MSNTTLHDDALFTMRDAAITQCEILAMRCKQQATEIERSNKYADAMRERAMAAEERLERMRVRRLNKWISTLAVVVGLLVTGVLLWKVWHAA